MLELLLVFAVVALLLGVVWLSATITRRLAARAGLEEREHEGDEIAPFGGFGFWPKREGELGERERGR